MRTLYFELKNDAPLIIEPIHHYYDFHKGDKIKVLFEFKTEIAENVIEIEDDEDGVVISFNEFNIAYSYEIFLNGEFYDKDKCGL